MPRLTDEEKELINKNSEKTPTDIFKLLKKEGSNVKSISGIIKHLEAVADYKTKRVRKNFIKREIKEQEFFNVNNLENWIA